MVTTPNILTPAEEAALQLVDAWASLSKASSIYPDASDRVRGLAQQVVDMLDSETIAVEFVRDGVQVNDDTLSVESIQLAGWLKQRLDNIGLSGVRVWADLTADALIEFTRVFVDSSRTVCSLDESMAQWGRHSFLGLTPLERRFAEVYLGEADSDGLSPKWNSKNDQGGRLAQVLEQDELIQKRMRALEAAMAKQAAEFESPSASIDFVGRIVDLLPAEITADENRTREAALEILDGMLNELNLPDTSERELELYKMMLGVSRKLFFRGASQLPKDLDASAPKAGSKPERTASAPTAEGVEQLTRDVRSLPVFDPAQMKPAALERADELAETCLAMLDGPDTKRANVEPHLAKVLALRDPAVDRVFREYVEKGDAGQQVAALRVLRARGQLVRFHDLSVFSQGEVAAWFPRYFIEYMDSIDAGDKARAGEFVEVCQKIGRAKILRAENTLRGAGGLAEPRRLDVLAANPHTALIPLLHVALKERGMESKAKVLTILQRLEMEEPAASPLWVVPEVFLPLDFVTKLTAALPTRVDGVLREKASWVVARFLDQTRGKRELEARRVSAIRLATTLPSATLRASLREIVKRRGLLGLWGEPSAVRAAAREALGRMPRNV